MPSGEFFIGGGWPADIQDDGDHLSCRVRDDSVRARWCGLEARAFDGVPLIGPAPGLVGLYLTVGFSGHGFQIAPAVGRTVADGLIGKSTPELDGLAPARVAGFHPAAVAAFKADRTAALGVGLLG